MGEGEGNGYSSIFANRNGSLHHMEIQLFSTQAPYKKTSPGVLIKIHFFMRLFNVKNPRFLVVVVHSVLVARVYCDKFVLPLISRQASQTRRIPRFQECSPCYVFLSLYIWLSVGYLKVSFGFMCLSRVFACKSSYFKNYHVLIVQLLLTGSGM